MLRFLLVTSLTSATNLLEQARVGVVPQAAKSVRVEYARGRREFEQAFRLVYQEYLRKGYCSVHPTEMRISFYHTLPDSVTFCLWRAETLLATASLIFDSPVGLPMEEVYPDEIRNLRKQGRRLCEVSLLALNSDVISKGILPLYFAERLRCLYQIFKPIFWYARNTAHTDLCIAMNPSHKMLYSSLYFEQFGNERIYESVRGNPSIAMRLNFDRLEERAQKKTPGLHKLFFGNHLELRKISDLFRWNAEDFGYFFVQHSDVLRKAKPEQIEYLAQSYPELRIRNLLEPLTDSHRDGRTPTGTRR